MASTDALHDLLSAAAYHFEKNRPLILMEIHLLISALFPIYAGAHASLSRPSSAAKPVKRSPDHEEDEEEEERKHEIEGLSPRDAVIFPVTAGIVLAGLYFAIKAYGADMINLVLGGYFSLIGTFSVAKLISDSWDFVQSFITPDYYRHNGRLWKLVGRQRKAVALVGDEEVAMRPSPLPGIFGRIPLPAFLMSLLWDMRDLTKHKYAVKGFLKGSFDFSTILTQHNALSALFGIVAIGYSMFVDKPWWLTNLQGFAVSYGALQLMSPTTFVTGTLILSGLFFYDIWAVFFTPLMVTVAKNLDVPIKLVFPRPDEPSGKLDEPPIKSYSMLGLGDIVLPGLMIALALRFDLYMFYLRKQRSSTKATDGEKATDKAPYIIVTGHWGDKFWSSGKSTSEATLPAHLRGSFPKPYFHATLIGYVLGMLLTLGFMTVFQHAQPALLYLVPCVLIFLWGSGLLRGELTQMWEFTEAVTGEAIDDDEKNDKHDQDNVDKDEADSESVLSTVWHALFGHKADKKSAGDLDKEKPKEDSVQKKADAKSAEAKSDDGVPPTGRVFSLEISHHRSKSGAEQSKTDAAQPSVCEKEQPDIIDKVSDDTVFVSSSDYDSSKEAVKLE